ncbi:protein-disulfide isomerase [Novipirellula rosea]|uniref:tetratricopeptide repeat protein n=1 Tax=Novipirellula rosea TaxID=1031540 RepID=UPI0031EDFF3B
MSVDQYATCPCGSGKKIKFCKCKESVSELDRVMKMVEGGQVVPALDRLSTILSEHPDAAWALAIRGRLLLDLREYDSLAENADRFIRLQPSNPLALTQRAAAQVFRGDVKSATDSMLEALTESGRDVDAFVLDVSSAVAFLLGRQGVFLTARVYASLAMMAQGYEGSQMSGSLLRQLNSSPTLNQLVKSIPQPIQRPDDADWGERYDEAATLLRSNKVLLAEAKFQSLRRTLPDEPAILSGLLTCAIWRGDVAAQSDFLKKLSACESLDFEERVQFRAVSCLVNPDDKDLAAECFRLDADIESAEPVEMAMIADSRFAPLPAEMLAQMRESEDDVPPRAGFQVLDRDRPEVAEGLPPIDQIPEAIAMAFVYGKQTDRSARVEIHDVTSSVLDDVRAQIQKAIGDSVQLNQKPSDPLPFLAVVQPQVAMVRFKASAVEADAMQEELTNTRMPLAIANAKWGILGNASLVDTADDDSKLLERTVVVRVAEQYDAIISKGEEVLGEVYRLAKIEPLPTLTIGDDEIESVANTDLNRIDSSQLNEESCLYLLQRAQQISSTPAIRHFAKRLIEADLPEDQKMAKLLAYSTLVNASGNAKDAIATINEAKAFAEANELPTANLLLSEVSLRLQAGDGEGFQKAIETLTQRYGNEPEVMAQLQQMLISMGLIRPDGSPRRGPAPGGVAPAGAEPAAGGIWTPDGGGAAAPPADPAAGGGSKLWVPGMD